MALNSGDSDSEWSIEILDGDCVNKPTNVKQAPTVSKPVPSVLHPLFTEAAVSGVQSTCRASSQRSFSSHQGGHTPFTTDYTRQFKPLATVHTQGPLVTSGSFTQEQSRFQKKYSVAKPYQPTQLTGDTSSSSGITTGKGEPSLPVYSYMEYQHVPTVVYIRSETEANSLVQTLKGPLGFDLEWRVMWQRGAQERRTALVQLCDHHRILLIQVSSMTRFPRKVLEVIESPHIVKTGANILNDGEKLFRDFGIRAKGLVELGAFAIRVDDDFKSTYNREVVSLARMVAMYTGRTLLKGKVRVSDWEASLSQKMIEYAANDCHCALMVYTRLQEIAAKAGKTLDIATYSCQVNPRPLKIISTVSPTAPQRPNASMKSAIPDYCIPEPPRPQQLRAYRFWHMDKMPLDRMCMKLRTGTRVEPLKESTVISYVIGALQADPRLPFDMNELRALVLMEAGSWQRHRQWIESRQ